MQRLRRISQIGLSSLVYPGAVHNRFTHSIGAMHLMSRAISTLREKGFDPEDELIEVLLENDELKIDGNLAVC